MNTPGTPAPCSAVDSDTVNTVSMCLCGCGRALKAKRPQSRFFSDTCRYAYHNRHRVKKNPPPMATHTVMYQGELLAFTSETLADARRLGRELASGSAEGFLTISEVEARLDRCRARVYQLMRYNQFPKPIVVSAPGHQRRVAWPSGAVSDWLANQAGRPAKPPRS